MKLKKQLISVVLMCFAVWNVAAQQQEQGTLNLTLDEAKQYALQHNRTVRQSGLEVEKAEKAKWQTLATMLPHVDAKLGYTNFLGYKAKLDLGSDGSTTPPPATGNPMVDQIVSEVTNQIGQMMGGGGSEIEMNPYGDLTIQASMAVSGIQIVGTQLNKLAVSMSQTNKNLTDLDIKANVSTAYISVLVAEESRRLLMSSRENLSKMHENTAKLYEVGMAESTAIDLLDVQIGIVDNAVHTAERNIELAYNALRLTLGSESTPVKLTETLEQFVDKNSAYTTAGSSFDLKQNYTVQLLDKNVELYKKQLNMRRWEYGPTLAAFYQYSGRTYFGQNEGFNMSPPHTVGATLSIPIFSSGERWAKVQQAKIDLKSAQLQKDDAIEGLLVQEKQLRFNLKSALEAYELQKKFKINA